MKTCFKCGLELPLTEFYRHSMMRDGHLGKCKDCTKADMRNHWRESADYQQTTTARKRQLRAAQRAWDKRNPHKKDATTAVHNAVRDKRLDIKACEYCGDTDLLQAHHWDYDRPLDVTWLCPRCHRIADQARREAERRVGMSKGA